MSPAGGLPAVADAALPREVRAGSKQDKQDYKTALAFERMLVAQLAEQALPRGEDAGLHGGAVQDAFTDALMEAGGLGLASRIHAQIKDRT